MGVSQEFPSFSCELRITQAQNVEFIKSTGNLFARFYLPAGNKKRVQLNTRNVSPKSVTFWNESFSLECSCPQEFLETLKHESLILELRQSKVLQRIRGSHLVGRSEISWKKILESPDMEFKQWVKMDLVNGSGCEDVIFREPELQVEVKIRVGSFAEELKENRRSGLNHWNECGCKDGHDQYVWFSAQDYDIFAALEFDAF